MQPIATIRRFGIPTFVAVVASAMVTYAQGPIATPVADAASHGDVATVQSLLKQGADASAAQGDGMTALHYAADSGNAALAAMLVHAGANVNAGTRLGHY